MKQPYKICFLGYSQLTKMAFSARDELAFDDVDLKITNCLPENVPETINNALLDGYEVFIAGGANAATFAKYSQAHMQELIVRDIDYLIAIKKALKLGSRPAVVNYSYSREVNIELLSELAGAPIGLIRYEDDAELMGKILDADYDVIVGTSFACSCAEKCGLASVLLYAGKDTAKRAIIRARQLAIELRKEERYNVINNALLHDSPIGIIVTNENGWITMANNLAGDYLGLPVNSIRGRQLSLIASNLDPQPLLSGDSRQTESYKILNGVRFRCVQDRLSVKGQDIGVLTMLRIDNTKIKKPVVPGDASGAAHWSELVCRSEPMKKAVSLGKTYADSSSPLAIFGDVSTDRQVFAECVHTGGIRAKQPLIIVNLSSISENDVGRHLLGCSDKTAPLTGLLEMANNGTLILKNLQNANRAVQDCLLDVVAHHQVVPTGGYSPIPVNIRFITLFNTLMDQSRIREDLYQRLCTLQISLPALAERAEDIPVLFNRLISKHYDGVFDMEQYKRAADTLCVYSWPGNMSEMDAVIDRFAREISDGTVRLSQHTVHALVVKAIGPDALFRDLVRRHPELRNPDMKPEQFHQLVEKVKYFTGFNNAEIAEHLGMSRTSLWRMLK